MNDGTWQEGIDALLDVFPQTQAKPDTWRRFLDDIPDNLFLAAIERIIKGENVTRTTNIIGLVRQHATSSRRLPGFQFSADELQFREFYLNQLAAGKGIMSAEQRLEIKNNRIRIPYKE